MAKNFVQVGENLTLPVDKDVKSGELVQVGEIVGVALTDAKTDNGTNYYTTLATTGVWELTVTANTTVGGVVSVKPTGGTKPIAVGFATKAVTITGSGKAPVLLNLGLAHVATA